jgi:thiopeptide-type bacteriocin biosynthesis protein
MKDDLYLGQIMNLFYTKLNHFTNDHMIWKIQVDTYNRELERYGNTLIEEAESIFYIDSENMLSIIRKLNVYKNENYRWMVALKMMDYFLSDFSFDTVRKQQLMKTMSESFKMEFGFNQYNAKQFNSKFRENKNVIESVLNKTITDEIFLTLCNPIESKLKKLTPVIKQLTEKIGKDKSGITLNDLLTSYIHMMLNRLFRSKNRIHELILYDFMYRYYTSEMAKQKYCSSEAKKKQ